MGSASAELQNISLVRSHEYFFPPPGALLRVLLLCAVKVMPDFLYTGLEAKVGNFTAPPVSPWGIFPISRALGANPP